MAKQLVRLSVTVLGICSTNFAVTKFLVCEIHNVRDQMANVSQFSGRLTIRLTRLQARPANVTVPRFLNAENERHCQDATG